MKFIISSSVLLKQLQLAGGVLSTNNTLPILDNFLFEIDGNTLTISASDIETTITTQVEVESKEGGRIAVPAKLLIDTLKTFPDQPLTFIVDGEKIELASELGNYSLSGYNADEFPKFPNPENTSNFELAEETLQRAISKTIFATGNDEIRPVMCGVFCQIEENQVTFAATDAHKLVRYRRSDVTSATPSDFIIPKKPLTLLKSILGNSEELVKVDFNDTNAFFSFGTVKLACRLVEGKYPNYQAVIPQENPNKVIIEKAGLLSSIKRVSIFANKTTHQVRLNISGNNIKISAEDIDFANKADESLPCNYEGNDMEIGFNSRFIIEMLTNLDTPEVMIEMSAPNRAGIITPYNSENESEDILMLVMPVMLSH